MVFTDCQEHGYKEAYLIWKLLGIMRSELCLHLYVLTAANQCPIIMINVITIDLCVTI